MFGNTPPNDQSLDSTTVHVWHAALDELSPAQIAELTLSLSADEIDRANRFHFQQDQQRFIAGRGALRNILSRYLHIPASTIAFEYNPFGKPGLARSLGSLLRFNVSHSGGQALYAVTYERAIGVDIERVNPMVAYEQLAARFFSPTEYQKLCSLPPELRRVAFFTCWTRKEAYVKAHGIGLSMALDHFAVSLAPDEPARILYTLDDPAEASRWSLQSLSVGPGYQAALAVEGHGWNYEYRSWRG
ncbi:MAG: 4'-phosphopantetheinyl transferase superfamily protein [Kouleothrix sp.]|nr:4'-phosphopantetheinyl transferase superfamily protein [Kouleothrix sp.]